MEIVCLYESTISRSHHTAKSPPDENERKVSSVIKLEKGVASNTTVQNGGAEEDKPDSLTARPSGEPTIIEELLEVPLEPMLEAHEPDDCTDFYYISRGWGLYLTVRLPLLYRMKKIFSGYTVYEDLMNFL